MVINNATCLTECSKAHLQSQVQRTCNCALISRCRCFQLIQFVQICIQHQLHQLLVHLQDKLEEGQHQADYLNQHGQPEWADLMGINPKDWALLQMERPQLCKIGPDAVTLSYFQTVPSTPHNAASKGWQLLQEAEPAELTN